MRITNNSSKIINIGSLSLFPGDTQTLPVDFEENPTVKFFEEQKWVTITGETEKAPPVEPSTPEEERALLIKKLTSMRKDDIIAYAIESGVEIDDTDTKEILIRKIVDAIPE